MRSRVLLYFSNDQWLVQWFHLGHANVFEGYFCEYDQIASVSHPATKNFMSFFLLLGESIFKGPLINAVYLELAFLLFPCYHKFQVPFALARKKSGKVSKIFINCRQMPTLCSFWMKWKRARNTLWCTTMLQQQSLWVVSYLL